MVSCTAATVKYNELYRFIGIGEDRVDGSVVLPGSRCPPR